MNEWNQLYLHLSNCYCRTPWLMSLLKLTLLNKALLVEEEQEDKKSYLEYKNKRTLVLMQKSELWRVTLLKHHKCEPYEAYIGWSLPIRGGVQRNVRGYFKETSWIFFEWHSRWSSDERSIRIPLGCILDEWYIEIVTNIKAQARATWGSNDCPSAKAGRKMLMKHE